jgi:V/A-type H+-transporting ATPase subunit B
MSLVTTSYRHVTAVSGPLVFLSGEARFGYGAMLDLRLPDGEVRSGQVLETSRDLTLVQVLEGTSQIGPAETEVSLRESVATIKLSPYLLGRVLSGSGRPRDGLPEVVDEERRPIHGAPLNPLARQQPCKFVETGLSAIDGFNTLVRGQKLPVFSCPGLPAHEIVSFILEHARLAGRGEAEDLVVVFAAMGITHREAAAYLSRLRGSEAGQRLVTFLNLADDPAIERLVTPRYALTAAEYFAFQLELQVLVVLADMTNYCEALREVSGAREEIPGRRGYPGMMYTDLASLYERAGAIHGCRGSITQIPVVTMPDDDLTHPIVDLTGYITEGQIVLSRALHQKGIFPPIDVLPSLSRLMNNGIGAERTREDHRELANQLYACYANGIQVRRLVSIVGEEALSEADQRYLVFADRFERELIHQAGRRRTILQTLDQGWELLHMLPAAELTRIRKPLVDRYYAGTTPSHADESVGPAQSNPPGAAGRGPA